MHVKRFIMATNNGKGNILLSCDHVTAYLSISFVERESRSQKDQKRRFEVQTEGLPCFDLCKEARNNYLLSVMFCVRGCSTEQNKSS